MARGDRRLGAVIERPGKRAVSLTAGVKSSFLIRGWKALRSLRFLPSSMPTEEGITRKFFPGITLITASERNFLLKKAKRLMKAKQHRTAESSVQAAAVI